MPAPPPTRQQAAEWVERGIITPAQAVALRHPNPLQLAPAPQWSILALESAIALFCVVVAGLAMDRFAFNSPIASPFAAAFLGLGGIGVGAAFALRAPLGERAEFFFVAGAAFFAGAPFLVPSTMVWTTGIAFAALAASLFVELRVETRLVLVGCWTALSFGALGTLGSWGAETGAQAAVATAFLLATWAFAPVGPWRRAPLWIAFGASAVAGAYAAAAFVAAPSIGRAELVALLGGACGGSLFLARSPRAAAFHIRLGRIPLGHSPHPGTPMAPR